MKSSKFLCGYCHAEYDTPEEVRECAVQRHGQKRTTSAVDLVERLQKLAHQQADGTDFHKGRQLTAEDTMYWVAADTITRLQAALEQCEADAFETARQRAAVLFNAYALGVTMQYKRGEAQFTHDVKTFNDELTDALRPRYRSSVGGE